MSTCFGPLEQFENESELADQLSKWYNLESYENYKQIALSSAADALALSFLGNST